MKDTENVTPNDRHFYWRSWKWWPCS